MEATTIDPKTLLDPGADKQRQWVEGEARYTTDTKIMVRTPAPCEGDTGGGIERAKRIADDCITGEWKPWPVDATVVEAQGFCLDCKGSGFIDQKTCRKCRGAGDCTCCGEECSACFGRGFSGGTPCPGCKGEGQKMQPLYILIGRRAIATLYADKLKSLPGIQYSFGVHGDEARKPLGFRFDGGEGALMPMLPPAEAK